jgi:competence protein ComEA
MKHLPALMVLSCTLLSGSSHGMPIASPAMQSLPVRPKINLNTASANLLMHSIKGIGHQRAIAIVQFRQKHGPFRTITDLAAVRGIGIGFVQKHRAEMDATFIL